MTQRDQGPEQTPKPFRFPWEEAETEAKAAEPPAAPQQPPQPSRQMPMTPPAAAPFTPFTAAAASPPALIPPVTPQQQFSPFTASRPGEAPAAPEPGSPRRPELPSELEATRAHHPFFDTEQARTLTPPSTESPRAPHDSPRAPFDSSAAPTEAMLPPLMPTQAMPFTETRSLDGAAAAPSESADVLGKLFSESNFVEYEDKLIPVGTEAIVPGEAQVSAPRTAVPKGVLWTGLGLVAALLAIALFLVGTRLPGMLAASGSPLPAPVLPEQTSGPVMPGSYAWDALLGTECLEPFESAWQDGYSVVPCFVPHGGQLLATGEFGFAAFPGPAQLEAQARLECTTPGLLDLEAAGSYTDVQISVSYPVSAEQWDEGGKGYYCFVSRAGMGPLTGSLAMAADPVEADDDEEAESGQ